MAKNIEPWSMDKDEQINALAREVDKLKAKLKIWHDVDTADYIEQLERQLADRDQAWAHELEQYTKALIDPHHGPSVVVKHHMDVMLQRVGEAQQRIVALTRELNTLWRRNMDCKCGHSLEEHHLSCKWESGTGTPHASRCSGLECDVLERIYEHNPLETEARLAEKDADWMKGLGLSTMSHRDPCQAREDIERPLRERLAASGDIRDAQLKKEEQLQDRLDTVVAALERIKQCIEVDRQEDILNIVEAALADAKERT